MIFNLITRKTGLAAALLIGCVAAWVIGCSTSAPGNNAKLTITHTRFHGCVWNQGHASASVISQDGGYAYAVPGGSLWWFGDTFRGSRDAAGKPQYDGTAVSCALAWLDATNQAVPPVLQYLRQPDGKVAQAIPFLPAETWDRYRLWPLGGLHLNGKSYIYYALIEIFGKGAWDFRGVGSGLAWATQPLGVHQRVHPPAGWRFPVAPTTAVVEQDWVYLYSVEKRGDQQGIWLSRVRTNEIENPQAYEHFCGPGPAFSPNTNQQALFMKDIYGQTAVAWNAYLGQYVMATSSDMFHPRQICLHTADRPYGPWRRNAATFLVPENCQDHKVNLVYSSFFHPELFRDHGRVMVLTFSTMLKDAGFDCNNEIVEIEVSKK